MTFELLYQLLCHRREFDLSSCIICLALCTADVNNEKSFCEKIRMYNFSTDIIFIQQKIQRMLNKNSRCEANKKGVGAQFHMREFYCYYRVKIHKL